MVQCVPRTVQTLVPHALDDCAVIGSSGILQGSGHGAAIDNHQHVWRVNLHPNEGVGVIDATCQDVCVWGGGFRV
jgi:glycosyl transferase family 29 (putative sialyltransferase)